LLGAQRCDGAAWGYYVQMEGTKPYSTNLDGHCCLSSGPRGIALIPTFALTTDADGIVVNLYDAGSSQLRLRDHTEVALKTETRYPGSEKIHITVELAEAKSFAIKLRLPAWCGESHVEVNGRKTAVKRNPEGYAVIQREWKNGDRVGLRFKLEPRLITGDHLNHGKVALTYGPLVLAADEALLGEAAQAGSGAAALPAGKAGLPLNAIAVADAKLARLKFKAEPAPDRIKNWAGQQVFRIRGVTRKAVGGVKPGVPLGIRLVAFADAGVTGSHYKVWLPLPRELYRGNVLLDAVESRSRPGDLAGLITDEDFETAVCTRDGKKAEEDWFAVELTRPATIQRVVFAHGKTFHDGGWFDASAGKPRIQVQRTKNGAWETVSEIAAYPATTPKDSGEMDGGENFNCPLPAPVRAWGIRVIGKPAGGDNPQQAFSSCAELQAFGE
jgi:hypothetical protein